MLNALIVSNMRAGPGHPERGSFVRDQAAAIGALQGVSVELFEFPPGRAALLRAAATLSRRRRAARFDVVHAHFGLTAWPAEVVPARVHALTLHGTDVHHPLTRQVTRLALPFIDLVAAASPELAGQLPGRAAGRRAAVLPCGVDIERFRPLPRALARARLGLPPDGPYLLFPADQARPEKRHDRAAQLAGEVPLLTLGGVDPKDVPLFVNASNAVLVTSEREGFGLAALEALACDVPVLATPVGIHREALAGVDGALCEPFELARWRAALAPHLAASDPRIAGRQRATRFSSARMAERVLEAWRTALAGRP